MPPTFSIRPDPIEEGRNHETVHCRPRGHRLPGAARARVARGPAPATRHSRHAGRHLRRPRRLAPDRPASATRLFAAARPAHTALTAGQEDGEHGHGYHRAERREQALRAHAAQAETTGVFRGARAGRRTGGPRRRHKSADVIAAERSGRMYSQIRSHYRLCNTSVILRPSGYLAAGGGDRPLVEERRVIDRLVAAVQAGQSQVLVMHGEAGVGKTALLDYLAGQASGCRVVRTVAVQSEMELPFAGLHQMCAPLLGWLGGVPGPQRSALLTAFGMSAGPPPDRFLVGLAVLSLLSAVADDRPLMGII